MERGAVSSTEEETDRGNLEDQDNQVGYESARICIKKGRPDPETHVKMWTRIWTVPEGLDK